MKSLSFRRGVVRANQTRKLNSELLNSTTTNLYTASANHWVTGYVRLANRDSQTTKYTLYAHDTANSAVNSNEIVSGAKVPQGGFAIIRPTEFGDDQQIQGKSSNQAVVATLFGELEDRS